MLALSVLVVTVVAGSALAQVSTVPAYITSSKYSGYPSLSSAALQSMLARQLYASSSSPRRAVAPTASPARYGLSTTSNPSIVAIPLYVRNQAAAQKSSAFYDSILSSQEKKGSASSKYVTYQPKKSYADAIPYRSETPISRYEKPSYTYAKYDQPKASPSSYEPVRSYELKNSEPGYGDASSVSLLTSGYGQQQGAISIAYPPTYKQSASHATSRPQLKAVEYDDNQKSALSDFAAALENFDLKSITNQDIYDLPAVNPPLTRISSKKQSEQRAPAEDSYASSSSSYSKSQAYDTPKQSYGSSSAVYDEARPSYAPQPASHMASAAQSYAAPETYSSYGAAASSVESYRPSADSYRSSESGRAAAYTERQAPESYRASGSDSYGSQATYVPAPSNYETLVSPQETYASRPAAASSYGAASGDYYAPAASSARPNPEDPNCPFKDQSAATEYVPESSNYSGKLSSGQSVKEEAGYETDELDPSKLDLKIVHLPVSVLRRLVGNGELALPSFNKKK